MMKQNKLVLAVLFLIFSLIAVGVLVGCENFGGEIEAAESGVNLPQPENSSGTNSAERKLITLRGSLRMPEGVVPSSFFESAGQTDRGELGNSKAIIPGIGAGSQNAIEKYVITAHCTSYTTEDVTVEVTESTYTISLLTGTWDITCEGKTAEAEGIASRSVLEATVSGFEVLASTTGAPDLQLAPKTGELNGSVKINIKAEATSGITDCSVSLSGDGMLSSATNISLNSNLDENNYYNGVFQKTLSAGTYKITFRFLKDSVCVFSVQEVFYVFSDCVTDRWTSTSVYNDSNSIFISKALAEKGIQNELYVDGDNGEDSYIGDFWAPLKTVGKAVELLEKFGYTTGTVNVKARTTTFQDSEIIIPISITSLKIKAYGGTGTGSGKGLGDGTHTDVLETDFMSNATISQKSPFTGNRLFTSTYTELEFVGITLLGNGSETGGSGGAIRANKPLKLTDCYISGFDTGSSTGTCGGAVYFTSSSTDEFLVKNTYFNHNLCNKDGGTIYVEQGILVCDGIAVKLSSVNNYGGGIYLASGAVIKTAAGSAKNYIQNNSAKTYGGGIYKTGNRSGDILLDNFVITDNSLSNLAGGCYGGGLYISSVNNFKITNSIITGNQATKGSGIYLSSTTKAEIGSAGGTKTSAEKVIIGITSDYTTLNYADGIYLSNSTAHFYGNAEINSTPKYSIDCAGSSAYLYNDFTIDTPLGDGSAIYVEAYGKLFLAENFTTPGIHGKISLEKPAFIQGTKIFDGSDPAGQVYSDFFVIDNDSANNTSKTQWTINNNGELESPYSGMTDFYIASVASGGSDTNIGTKQYPLYTLQKAVDIISTINIGNGTAYNIYLKENMEYDSEPASGSMVKIRPSKELILNIRPNPSMGDSTRLVLTKAGTAANCGAIYVESSSVKVTVTVRGLQLKNYEPPSSSYLFSCTGTNSVLNIEDCIIGKEIDDTSVGTDVSLIQELTTSTKYANKGNLINVRSNGTVNVSGRTVIANNYYNLSGGNGGFIYCNSGTLNFGKNTLIYANATSSNQLLANISKSTSSFNGTCRHNNCVFWHDGKGDYIIGDDAVFEENLYNATGYSASGTGSAGGKFTVGNAVFKNNGLLNGNNVSISFNVSSLADIQISEPKECEGYFIGLNGFSAENSFVLSSAVDSSKWNESNPLKILCNTTDVYNTLDKVLKGNPGDAGGAGSYTLTEADCAAFTVVEKVSTDNFVPHAISLDAANNVGVVGDSTGEGSFAAGQPYEENTVAADTWNVSGATGGTISLSLKQNGTALNDVDWSTADIKVFSRGEDISSRTGISITGNKVTLPAGIPVAENIQIYCKVIYNGTEYGGLYDVTVME